MKRPQMLGLFAFTSRLPHTARFAFLLLATALTANCSGGGSGWGGKTEPAIEANVAPADYRTQAIETIHRMLDDPTGIRDAFIAEPALKQSGTDTRYIVCLRYNAKTREGAYGGTKDRAAFFYAGKITGVVDATREMCGNAPYQPFPELEKLCREVVCPKR
jgi:hypothetical protein